MFYRHVGVLGFLVAVWVYTYELAIMAETKAEDSEYLNCLLYSRHYNDIEQFPKCNYDKRTILVLGLLYDLVQQKLSYFSV